MKRLAILLNSCKDVGVIKALHKVVDYIINCLLDGRYSSQNIQDNLILFMSSPDFSDNSRVLFDYMVEHGLNTKYQLVWVVTNHTSYSILKEKNISCVLRYSIFPSKNGKRFLNYAKTSRWVFHTHGFYFNNSRREGQTIVNLRHGGMGFKRNKNIPSRTGRENDFNIISGIGETTISSALLFHNCSREQLLPLGCMRNDLLFKQKKIDFLDSTSDKKILWMPTFRESGNSAISDNTLIQSKTGFPILYTPEMMIKFNEHLKLRNIQVFRTVHQLQKKDALSLPVLSNIHLLTNSDLEDEDIQMYEIFNHFDAMISDYSSASFDYLYLDRPLGYTLDDIDAYSNSRGFLMDNPIDYMPGHHMYTYSDLIKFIDDIAMNNDQYASERKRVKELVGLVEGGNSCQKLIEYFGIN